METGIYMTKTKTYENITSVYRLLQTVDASGGAVFSLFLTTTENEIADEAFVYDLARRKEDALLYFQMLCDGMVSACTLYDVVHDLLAER